MRKETGPDPEARPPTRCGGLLLHEGQIALELNLVRHFEEHELGDGDVVIAEERPELGPHLYVVAGEAEALLRLDLV